MDYNVSFKNYDGDLAITFYDADYAGQKGFTRLGQHVCTYFVRTLLERRESIEDRGLDLHGGEPKWVLTGEQMKDVFEMISGLASFTKDKK